MTYVVSDHLPCVGVRMGSEGAALCRTCARTKPETNAPVILAPEIVFLGDARQPFCRHYLADGVDIDAVHITRGALAC